MLSAFPLSVEWLSINPTSFEKEIAQQGNFAIVSSFLPEIEIWDLDVVNAIEPTIILGGEVSMSKNKIKKMKKKNPDYKPDSHKDSV